VDRADLNDRDAQEGVERAGRAGDGDRDALTGATTVFERTTCGCAAAFAATRPLASMVNTKIRLNMMTPSLKRSEEVTESRQRRYGAM